MSHTARLSILLATALLAPSCGPSARYVRVQPEGGVVAVPRNTPENRARAQELMEAHCAGGYDVNLEEEVIVGTETRVRIREDADRSGDSRARAVGRTTPETEWRIHFRCR